MRLNKHKFKMICDYISQYCFVINPLFISSRSSREPTYSDASANPVSEGETESPTKSADTNDAMVKASDEWSQAELLIWNGSKHYVRQQLMVEIVWGNLG